MIVCICNCCYQAKKLSPRFQTTFPFFSNWRFHTQLHRLRRLSGKRLTHHTSCLLSGKSDIIDRIDGTKTNIIKIMGHFLIAKRGFYFLMQLLEMCSCKQIIKRLMRLLSYYFPIFCHFTVNKCVFFCYVPTASCAFPGIWWHVRYKLPRPPTIIYMIDYCHLPIFMCCLFSRKLDRLLVG